MSDKEDKKLAEEIEEKDDDTPVAAPIEEAKDDDAEVAAPVSAASAPVAPPVAAAPVAQAPESASMAVSPAEPEAVTAEAPIPPPPAHPEDETRDQAEGAQHNEIVARDLSPGNINPVTYHGLFEKKDTLGKIGTLFGLMVAGAGAGLTHGPNVLLQMMDKELERDLEAQKARQENKRHWYSLALERERNLPENAARWAQAAEAASKADFANWSNKEAGIDNMSATEAVRNAQRMAILHKMQNQINMMPPGPDRDRQQAALDQQAFPYFMQQAQASKVLTDKKIALAKAMNPVPAGKSNPPPKGEAEPGKRYDPYNKNKFSAMVRNGRFAPNGRNSINPQDLPAAESEIKALEVNRNNFADADAAFNALASMKNAGQSPGTKFVGALGSAAGTAVGSLAGPLGAVAGSALSGIAARGAGETLEHWFQRNREIQLGALKTRLSHDVPADQLDNVVNSFLPAWNDTPESMASAHDQLMRHFTGTSAEAAPTLKRYGIYNPPPNYAFKAPKKEGEKKAEPRKGGYEERAGAVRGAE